MAEIIDVYKAVFDDSDLERYEKSLIGLGVTAEKVGKQLEDAVNPEVSGDFALGVNDGLNEIKKKYAELQKASLSLRAGLKNATDPAAIKLYTKAIDDLEKGMKDLEDVAKKTGTSLKGVTKEVGLGKEVFNEFFGAFTKASLIAFAIQKVVEFTKFAVKLSEETKLATKQFAAFLGNADKAAGVVADLTAFAGKKLLDTGEVFKAGKALLAFGEDAGDLTKVLGRIADISAATGKNFNELATIYGKARTAGVLYAEDINQLVDAGVPIVKEFSKQMGVSADQVKKLASEGKISFEELQLAIFNLTKEGAIFAGQAESQAETLTGVWQNLFNEVRPAISKIGEFFSDIAFGIGFILTDLVTGFKDLFGAATVEQGAFFDISKEQTKKALTEQDIEQKKLEEAAAKRRAELAKQSNKQAEDAARKRRQQRIDEFNQTLKDVDEQARAIDTQLTFNPVERVQKEYAQAIQAATELEKKLVGLADTPEQKAIVKASMSRLFDELLLSYNEELSKAETELEKLRKGKTPFDPLPQADTADDDLKFRAQGAIRDLQTAVRDAAKGGPTLAEILGLTPEAFDQVKENSERIVDFLGQIADARVNEAEAAVDAADRRIEAAEQALEKEQELALGGLANNTALREKELAEAKKAREVAEKERAKAVRTQILLDSAQQISSLITASANIFKGFSLLPLGGQILAIASITAMFAAFGAAKAAALKAAAIPKFRKGTRLEGPSHEGGGLAISDEHGNVIGEAEGKEWLIGTKPSREHDRFLQRLNEGEFSGVNLDRLFRPSASNPIIEAAPGIARVEKEFREIRETQHTRALESAYYAAAAQIVQAIEEKEVVTPLTNYRVTKKKGRNTYTKIVKAEN